MKNSAHPYGWAELLFLGLPRAYGPCNDVDLLIQRTIGGAGAIVLAFLIHTECIPACGTVDIVLGNVVHTYGDA